MLRRVLLLASLIAGGIFVASASAAIQAAFDCSPSCTVSPGTTVTFTSTSTSSTAIRNYEWDLDGDGLHGAADDPDEPYGPSAQSVQRTFADAGSYQVGLRVTNAGAEESTTTRTVTVAPPPPPPPPPPGVDPLVPPAPTGDEDGDGAANGRDLCPTTPRGLKPVEQGCSLVDVIVSPAALLESGADSVARARRQLKTLKGLRRPLKLMKAGLGRLRLAGKRLPGNPCLGSRTAGKALGAAGKGLGGVSKAVKKKQKSTILQIGRLHLRRPKAGGDTDALDTRYSALAFKRLEAKEAFGDLKRLRRLFGAACRARKGKQKPTIEARIVEIDPGYGLAKLSDGTSLALGAADGLSGLGKGVTVQAKGTLLDSGILIADKVTVQGLNFEPYLTPCVFIPKIAPVQDFAQSFTDLLYYDHKGYLEGDKYVLEGGMGINAVRGGNCDQFDDYRLHVFLDYQNSAGQTVVKKGIGWVRGFPDSDPPARIPLDIQASTANLQAKLTFELWGYDCTDATLEFCAGVQLQSKSESPAEVRPKGNFGQALYGKDGKVTTRFSIEDGSKTDFETATLLGDNLPPGTLPGSIVFGVGYGVINGQSTFPNRKFIVEGETFAVHDDEPEPDPEAYTDGVNGIPGGLLWAYFNGGRNGHPYHYVARLPNLITDVVSLCPTKAEHSFYRLPWKGGTIHSVTQGNNTDFTHKDNPDTPTTDQKFAFDFKMPIATKGRAPRGGLVRFVEDTLTENSNPNDVMYFKEISGGTIDLFKPANELVVQHQDGTFSQYFHMLPGGVNPKKDDFVERGDWVISVGNTGNSTGPHLHYHVMDKNFNGTIRIRFELRPLLNGVAGPVFTCAVPDKNAWLSTNFKPGS